MLPPHYYRFGRGLIALALSVAPLAACGGEDDDDANEPAVAATAGGEDLSMTTMAKKVGKQASTPSESAAAASASKKPPELIKQPPVPKLAAVAPEGDTQNQASAWGAPETEAGTPLPQRRADKAYEAEYNLGVIADREGKPDEALKHYGNALRIQPDYEAAVQGGVSIMLRRGSADSAVKYVEPIANKWQRNLYLQAIYADTLVRADRVDEAERVARRALARDERFVPAILALAKASERRGRIELAESTLEQAKEIDANNPEVHFLQAKNFQRKGELASALTSYRKAVELNPDYAEARMALGIQYMASGNYNEALAQFEATAKLVPTLVAAPLNLGDAYRALRRWQDAKREFDRALRMQAQLPEAHYNLALMYMGAGKDFPGLSELESLERALIEFNTYRTQVGPKLPAGDTSGAYMADIQRRIDREKKRIDREKANAEKARNKPKE
jgi:tetratricopeptide (TPR) repeat protein